MTARVAWRELWRGVRQSGRARVLRERVITRNGVLVNGGLGQAAWMSNDIGYYRRSLVAGLARVRDLSPARCYLRSPLRRQIGRVLP